MVARWSLLWRVAGSPGMRPSRHLMVKRDVGRIHGYSMSLASFKAARDVLPVGRPSVLAVPP